ncbi:MAG: GGDEF domain-containing response regulator [Fusobacteriota bacterium]
MEKYNILIVDDVSKNIQVAANILKSDNINIEFTKKGKAAIKEAKEKELDLILLDIMMPEMDGFEVCKRLKKSPETEDIPIIFLTAKSDIESVAKAFKLGAVDYVRKPFNGVELKARVQTHLELRRSKKRIEEFAKELEEKNRKLERLATKDSLTNLYNRRYMMEKINEELARFDRNNKEFSFIMGDIDKFKKFNDKYGHECGDYVLKKVSENLVDLSRKQDFVSRWGGEEFLILLPETKLDGAYKLATRIREKIEKAQYNYDDQKLSVTITLGVSEYCIGENIETAINRADDALYEGKKNGRNMVVKKEKRIKKIKK